MPKQKNTPGRVLTERFIVGDKTDALTTIQESVQTQWQEIKVKALQDGSGRYEIVRRNEIAALPSKK